MLKSKLRYKIHVLANNSIKFLYDYYRELIRITNILNYLIKFVNNQPSQWIYVLLIMFNNKLFEVKKWKIDQLKHKR
jgi:hypothetical protein